MGKVWLAALFGLVLGLGAADEAAAQQQYRWKYFSGIPATHDYNAKHLIPALANIKSRTNGNLDIRFVYIAETPFKIGDALIVIRDGQTEMTGWLPNTTSGTYPVLAVLAVPFTAPKWVSIREGMALGDKLYATSAVTAEMNKVLALHKAMVVGHYYSQPMNFWFTKAVNSVDEMKGLKIRTFSPELADLVSAIGATPVNIGAPEVYSALQRGVMDGVITGIGNMRGPKWSEVLKSGYMANIMPLDFFDLVSKDAYDKLPAEYQRVLAEEMAAAAKGINELTISSVVDEQVLLAKEGFRFVEAPASVYAMLRNLAREKVWPEWKKRAGPDAARDFDKIIAELEAASR
ncbi:MAG: TRAP transporter substrate-binding protein DctP [Alphaproteobacteria bacterium]